MTQPNPTNELPPNPACETLTIRTALTVNGVNITGAGTVQSDGVTLLGDGSGASKLAIKAVQHDASLTGNGTVASPLSVVAALAAVVFDTAGAQTNIRGNQLANRSPIDNTKLRIVNLGSKDGTVIPGAAGATANNATIGGGNDCEATAAGACVPGGVGCHATGIASFAANQQTLASGQWGSAFGISAAATGVASFACGNASVASNDGCFAACGSTASGAYAAAIGSGCVSSGNASMAFGLGCVASQSGALAMGTNCTSTFPNSTSIGYVASSTRSTQLSVSGGTNEGNLTRGACQTSILPYQSVTTTPGAAPAEAIVLKYHSNGDFIPEANKAYFARMYVIGAGIQAGVRVCVRMEVRVAFRNAGGVTTIAGVVTTAANAGDANALDWTLVPTVVGTNIVWTMTTGAIASIASASGKMEFEEVLF